MSENFDLELPRKRQRTTPEPAPISMRRASVADGGELWELVRECGTLDLNSSYSYLLLADRFADTCIVAEMEGEVVGFVTGFKPPRQPDTVFVWQIGVSPRARGRGLGKKLLNRLCSAKACSGVQYLETNVTPSNEASEALFRSFARANRCDVDVRAGYTDNLFPDGKEQERLFRIGPFQPIDLAAKD